MAVTLQRIYLDQTDKTLRNHSWPERNAKSGCWLVLINAGLHYGGFDVSGLTQTEVERNFEADVGAALRSLRSLRAWSEQDASRPRVVVWEMAAQAFRTPQRDGRFEHANPPAPRCGVSCAVPGALCCERYLHVPKQRGANRATAAAYYARAANASGHAMAHLRSQDRFVVGLSRPPLRWSEGRVCGTDGATPPTTRHERSCGLTVDRLWEASCEDIDWSAAKAPDWRNAALARLARRARVPLLRFHALSALWGGALRRKVAEGGTNKKYDCTHFGCFAPELWAALWDQLAAALVEGRDERRWPRRWGWYELGALQAAQRGVQ